MHSIFNPDSPSFTPRAPPASSKSIAEPSERDSEEWLEKCKAEVEKYQQLVLQSEEALRDQKRETESVRKEFDGATKANEEKLELTRRQIDDLAAERDALKGRLETMGLRKNVERNEGMNQAVKEREAALLRAERLKADLSREHAEARREREAHATRLEHERKIRQRIEEEKGEVPFFRPRRASPKLTARLGCSTEELEARLKESITELISLEDSQSASSAELDRLRTSLSLAESTLAKEKETSLDLLAKLVEADKRLAGKELSLQRERASIVATATGEVDRMRKEKEAMKGDLKVAIVFEDKWKKEQDRGGLLEKQLREAKEEHQAHRGEFTVKMAQLRAQFEEEVAKRDQAERELAQTKKIASEKVSSALSRSPRDADEASNLRQSSAVESSFKVHLVDYEKECAHLEGELSEASTNIDDLLNQVDSLKAALSAFFLVSQRVRPALTASTPRSESVEQSRSSSSGRDLSVLRTTTNRIRKESITTTTTIATRPFRVGSDKPRTEGLKSLRESEPGVPVKHQKEVPKPIKLTNAFGGLKVEG